MEDITKKKQFWTEDIIQPGLIAFMAIGVVGVILYGNTVMVRKTASCCFCYFVLPEAKQKRLAGNDNFVRPRFTTTNG